MEKSFFDKIKGFFKNSDTSGKDFKFGGYSVFSGIVIVCICIFTVLAVNSISSRYTKFDITSAKLFTVSEETKNVVKNLDKEVTVYLIAQEGSEDKIIKNLLERYDDLSDKLKVRTIDPTLNPNFAKQYTSLSVSPNSIVVESGDKSRFISVDDLYNSEMDYQTYTQTNEFIGESVITSAVSYVSGDNFPKIYITNGHGEDELSSVVSEGIKKNNIETASISLLTTGSIPDDATAVLIYAPSGDISVNEKDLLLEYLKAGGNLIVFSGYSGEEFPNLNSLLENYGVTLENSMIFEGDSSKFLRGSYNFGLVPDIESHDITDPLLNANYPVIAYMSKPIIVGEQPDSATVTELLKTSSKAYTKLNATNLETTEKEEGDAEGQYTVGVAITDKTANKDAHIFLISSDLFLSDAIIKSYNVGNQDLFLNAVNWMADREENIAIHPKTLTSQYLTISSAASAFWTVVFVFVVPLLVLAIGIFVWLRRKKK